MGYSRLAIFHHKLNACEERAKQICQQDGNEQIGAFIARHLQASFSLFLHDVVRRDFTISRVAQADSPWCSKMNLNLIFVSFGGFYHPSITTKSPCKQLQYRAGTMIGHLSWNPSILTANPFFEAEGQLSALLSDAYYTLRALLHDSRKWSLLFSRFSARSVTWLDLCCHGLRREHFQSIIML